VIIHSQSKARGGPRDVSLDGLKNRYVIQVTGPTKLPNGWTLVYDKGPSVDLQEAIIDRLKSTKQPDAKLDFDGCIAIAESAWWGQSSAQEIRTPIGSRGLQETVDFWFGANRESRPCVHGVIGASSGAGKSTLFHVLIAGLAIRYSPDHLRLYLVDGKDGVEFKAYQKLPHVGVLTLNSLPELTRSLLADLVQEMEWRSAIFRGENVQDYRQYCEKGYPRGPLPRILLIVDEYQELFEDDKEGHASRLLLQISHQGRSTGIHMLLASQRFHIPGMLNKEAIFSNVNLRAAMRMAIGDVQGLIEFGSEGKQAILNCDLPGKIVVNDQAGNNGGNVSGRVAFLESALRDSVVQKLADRAAAQIQAGTLQAHLPVTFSGQSQPSLGDNPFFKSLVEYPNWLKAETLEQVVHQDGWNRADWNWQEQPRIGWVGQEFNVRGHASVVLRRQEGQNLSVVGQNSSARYGILAGFVCGLAASLSPEATKFHFFDRGLPNVSGYQTFSRLKAEMLDLAGYKCELVTAVTELGTAIESIHRELKNRQKLPEEQIIDQPSLMVFLNEVDRMDSLRPIKDSLGLPRNSVYGDILMTLVSEGPRFGIHIIISTSSVRGLTSVINERQGLNLFAHRIALQMSDDESFTYTRDRKAAELKKTGDRPISALALDLQGNRSTKFKPYIAERTALHETTGVLDQLAQWRENLKSKAAPK
jgi:S-DNA-T family DNA segregation ATPase FtsK/SpoIIIE